MEIVLGFDHRRFLLKVRGFGSADRGFLLLQQRLVRIGFNLHQQIAFFDVYPVFNWQLNDFAGYLGGNFHLCFGLDFASGGNSLQYRSPHGLLGGHKNLLLAFTYRDQADEESQRRTGGAENNLAPAARSALFSRVAGEWGSGQGLMHGMLSHADSNYLALDFRKMYPFIAIKHKMRSTACLDSRNFRQPLSSPLANLLDCPFRVLCD